MGQMKTKPSSRVSTVNSSPASKSPLPDGSPPAPTIGALALAFVASFLSPCLGADSQPERKDAAATEIDFNRDIRPQPVTTRAAQDEDPTGEDKRPNILFILVDDQSPFDLKAYNPRSELETPTLDRLAAGGHGAATTIYHPSSPRRKK